MFDQTKQVTLKGTVREFQWTNPHAWIHLDVPNANGGKDTLAGRAQQSQQPQAPGLEVHEPEGRRRR